MKDLHQYLVSFLVGVVTTTACLLLFLSADLGRRSSTTLSPSAPKIASSVDPLNRTVFAFASKEANTTRKAHHTQKRRTPKSEDLPELLKRAAAGNNKTVLMTAVNEAWAAPNSLLDLFLERGDVEYDGK
ncbi:uncharacterized protein LOC109705577 [Ananas comosus]|uniref:Uncharacterized protein LOC109705577 n=1 Tax=Ananas comosus TaxID=4615 RepID=A0A6P5EKC7_ANACO|nr:uncharacterized protein LOC109705577 [Ananas comosus]